MNDVRNKNFFSFFIPILMYFLFFENVVDF